MNAGSAKAAGRMETSTWHKRAAARLATAPAIRVPGRQVGRRQGVAGLHHHTAASTRSGQMNVKRGQRYAVFDGRGRGAIPRTAGISHSRIEELTPSPTSSIRNTPASRRLRPYAASMGVGTGHAVCFRYDMRVGLDLAYKRWNSANRGAVRRRGTGRIVAPPTGPLLLRRTGWVGPTRSSCCRRPRIAVKMPSAVHRDRGSVKKMGTTGRRAGARSNAKPDRSTRFRRQPP